MIQTICWQNDSVIILDQRALPFEEQYITCTIPKEVMEAIRNMAIRGAPAIGIATAMGIALGIKRLPEMSPLDLKTIFDDLCHDFASTRPTARNLFWAIERMRNCFERGFGKGQPELSDLLVSEAMNIAKDDLAANMSIGRIGHVLLDNGDRVLTHCNAGALATAGYGTALGMIRAAREAGKQLHIYIDETRPVLQGARLTAWELLNEGIPATLITDSMAGALMQQKRIDKVITGADRIAPNGDSANKIGTYSLAVLARFHGIPFYIAASRSTLDFSISSGQDMIIEERSPEEVTSIMGISISPKGIGVSNPAFDITPGRLISAIITEAGITYPPYEETLPSQWERIR